MWSTRNRSLQSVNLLGKWKGELFAMAEMSISILWRRKQTRFVGARQREPPVHIPYLEETNVGYWNWDTWKRTATSRRSLTDKQPSLPNPTPNSHRPIDHSPTEYRR